VPLPTQINDIVLVTIDNETIKNMPQAWPYPRSSFAKLIQQILDAQARIIAFDFVFLNKTSEEEDLLLNTALETKNKIVLACSINEEGAIDFFTPPCLANKVPSGVITKFTDDDGIIRRNLSFLTGANNPKLGILSWGMSILKIVKEINMDTLTTENSLIYFRNNAKEEWSIPVESRTKSFLIHFQAHTNDFQKISFFRVLAGDFKPDFFKNKIVLVGLVSSVFGDVHQTAFGWLPGLTLNANAFLTLYSRNFLNETLAVFSWIAILFGTALAAFFLLYFKLRTAVIYIAAELFIFYFISYLLLIHGLVWNYSLFVTAVLICPLAARKIFDA